MEYAPVDRLMQLATAGRLTDSSLDALTLYALKATQKQKICRIIQLFLQILLTMDKMFTIIDLLGIKIVYAYFLYGLNSIQSSMALFELITL